MTKIEWTHRPGTKGESWNPVVGCSVVSPGCTNCYAMSQAARIERMLGDKATHYAGTTQASKAGPVWTGKVALAPERTLLAPLRAAKPRTYFVNSMGDLFHEAVPDAWIDRVFAVMALCPQHTFLVLTKRAGRMRAYVGRDPRGNIADTDVWKADGPHWEVGHPGGARAVDVCFGELWPLPNVWLGVSAEDQTRADARIPDLLATPAAVRFVSAEPLLGPIDFDTVKYTHVAGFFGSALRWHHRGACHRDEGLIYPALGWIIAGGESGPSARPMHPDWARSIRDQCAAAGVPFFFKQWGEYANEVEHGPLVGDIQVPWGMMQVAVQRLGKARAGHLLDGREHFAWPESARDEVPA